MALLGIDVSEWNGKLAWDEITCDFAILRGGLGYGNVDGEFQRNVANCTVPFGVYWFSYASTVDGAIVEAETCIAALKAADKYPVLPVFFDWEDDSARYCKDVKGTIVGRELYSAMACAFMDRIKAAGYKAGIYYNPAYYKSHCTAAVLDRAKYYQWCAYYGNDEPVSGAPTGEPPVSCDIWQYSQNGTLPGFTGDVNILYNTALLSGEDEPAEEPAGNQRNPNNRVVAQGILRITQHYGGSHTGVDVVNGGRDSNEITAHSPGTVVWCQTGIPNDTSAQGDNRSYGNCVKLKHPGGYYTLYAHLDSVAVGEGQTVAMGQKIGMMGNTGNSYGTHLHFEVRNTGDGTINPEPFLNADLPGCAGGGEQYAPGTYQVVADVLTVRTGPGTENDWLRFEQLTPNAQAQIAARTQGRPNGYVAGMVCDVYQVQGAWGQTPSGWICLDYCEREE